MGGWMESDPDWKRVRNSRTVTKQCPRCHNRGSFELVTDADGISLGGLLLLLPMKRYYALKCPICIYYESISTSQARELRR